MMAIQTSMSNLHFPGTEGCDSQKNGISTACEWIRGHYSYFNAERNNPVFMENAGGSQCPKVVIDAISNYMSNSYVQIGAEYELSKIATNTVTSAHRWMNVFMNGCDVGEVVLGSSTSQLLSMLSHCYQNVLKQGDEVIVHEANHEANAGPWVRLAERGGFTLKFWKVDYETLESSLESLVALLSPCTKIVALPHVSNIFGEILDLEKIVKLVKKKVGSNKVRVIADGVSYAPHRAIDVAKWGVDWYVFSTYKVYGPHMAVMFGTYDAFMDVKEEGPNHYFISSNDLSYKFELGCLCYEGCAGLLALPQYLRAVARVGESCTSLPPLESCETEEDFRCSESSLASEGHPVLSTAFDRGLVEAAFNTVAVLEQPLQEMLLSYLSAKSDVLIVGPSKADMSRRVPTISFVHSTRKSSEIARALQRAGFAVRNGHMYSHRIVAGLCAERKLFGNSVAEGVVRISLVHYNTIPEVTSLISCLDAILP